MSPFGSDSNRSVFLKSVSFCSVFMKNTFMRIIKNNFNNVFDNMFYKYKYIFLDFYGCWDDNIVIFSSSYPIPP